RSACARPMPPPAPVIAAPLPSRSPMMSSVRARGPYHICRYPSAPIQCRTIAVSSRRAPLAFMAVLGSVGWGALALAGPPVLSPLLPYVLFLCVIIAPRRMAVPLRAGPPVALASAFYIAAVGCLGPLGAGWMVAVALAIDALCRPSSAGSRASAGERLLFAFYFGGMTGGLLMLLGRALGAELQQMDELI